MISVNDANGFTTLTALDSEGLKIKSVAIPTVVFDLLTQLDAPIRGHQLQQEIAAVCGWPLNSKGYSARACGLIERITPGYKAYNGVIAVLDGTEVHENQRGRFLAFNEELQSAKTARMLSRRAKPSNDPKVGYSEEEIV